MSAVSVGGVMSIQTPYSPIKRYELPYGKPWYPPANYPYRLCGCGPDVRPHTESRAGYNAYTEQWIEPAIRAYYEADQDWPWTGDADGQLDLFKDVA